MKTPAPEPVFDLLHQLSEHGEALEATGALLAEHAAAHDEGRPQDGLLLSLSSIMALHGRGIEQLVEQLTHREAERAERQQQATRKGRKR